MSKRLLFLPLILLLLSSCQLNLGSVNAVVPDLSKGSDGKDDKLEDPSEPGEPSDPIPDPVEPEPLPIDQQYTFLNTEEFWNRVEEVSPIPRGKRCSNQSSYAYMGIARLVSQYFYESNFPMFPFGEVDYLYYRFLDNQVPEEPSRWEIFGQPELFLKLINVQNFVSSITDKTLTLTGITKHHEFDHDLHCRHRGGNVIDMRPFPATEPMTWKSKIYDRETNRTFIKELVSDPAVRVIFFNDPEILGDSEIREIKSEREDAGIPIVFQSASGHDNHIHIEFSFPEEIERITNWVFNRSQGQLRLLSSPNEYEYH